MERTERSSGNQEFLSLADLRDMFSTELEPVTDLHGSVFRLKAEELRPVPVGSDVWVIKDQKLGS